MIVLVDSNEEATNPAIVEIMRTHFTELQVVPLEFGDVNIILEDGSILSIERKNVDDFLGSIGDGRVFRQVERMSNGSKFYCIILVGNIHFDKDDMTVTNGRTTQWRGKSVRGAMMAIQWSGCPILQSANDEMYPFTIMEAVEFCRKPIEHTQGLGHHRIVTFPPVELSLEILSAFPGIGFKRAQALMEFV